MAEHAVLCGVYRDEAENIASMIRSWSGLFDAFITGIDTQTTDQTEAILRRSLQGVPGVFYPYRWHNSFAHARNTYLELAARTFPDHPWLIIADGDDLLDPRSRELVASLMHDCPPSYSAINFYVHLDAAEDGIPYLLYPRATLLRNRPYVRYKGAAHNLLDIPEEEQLIADGAIVWHRQKPHKRAYRERQRQEQNIPNLEQAFDGTPATARTLFYLGNSLADGQRYAEAERIYLQYLTIAPHPMERYQARIQLAALRFTAGDTHGAEEHVWAALREPDSFNRAEAYMHLGDCALAAGRVAEAIHWLTIAAALPAPVSSMFLNGAIYTWLPHWRLALVYDRVGLPDRALACAQKAYAWRQAPEIQAAITALEETIREQVEGNGHRDIPETRPLDTGVLPSTRVRPLLEAELERLISEIPLPGEQVAEPPLRMLMVSGAGDGN